MNIVIKAKDFKGETIPDLIDELWDNLQAQEAMYHIADYHGFGEGYALKSVASHLVTGEDYTLTIPDNYTVRAL